MVSVMQAPNLVALGVQHGFSLRTGGVSAPPFDSFNLGHELGDDEAAVWENHRCLAAAVGYAQQRLVEVRQVHGATVLEVPATCDADALAALRSQQADALVAKDAGTSVAVRTADCLPLLLADPASGAVAAVHAGWRGVVSDVVREAVAVLCNLADAPPERLQAAIFPHIRRCCFEIGEEVAQAFHQITRDAIVRTAERKKPHGDLEAAVRAQLDRAGVPLSQVDDVAGCTYCDAERFFSFRRDGKNAGRHLSVIVARKTAPF